MYSCLLEFLSNGFGTLVGVGFVGGGPGGPAPSIPCIAATGKMYHVCDPSFSLY